MPNMQLNERVIVPKQAVVANGGTVSSAIDKSKGAIIGLIVIPTVQATITFTVSMDNSNFYAITPPSGDFTAVPTAGKAFPADHLAFLAPYPYFKVTFGSAQTTGATILVPVMA